MDALKDAQDGLVKLDDGIISAKELADAYILNGEKLNSVFFLPEGTLEEHPELKDAMGLYISPDGKAATFDVILSVFPYDTQALDSVSQIRSAAEFSLKHTALEGAQIHIGGTSSVMSELRTITAEDFIRVMIFVLLGIFIVLVILLRSLTAPVYLILTILFSFYATLGITYLVFQVGMGLPGLSWSVPFFSFCLLVALGVDYNIFLISRVKDEYIPGQMRESTSRALANTGKIITSCGIIMAGTFTGLLFSPVNMLVQIGFATVVGLLIDTFIIRCMLVPALTVTVGELNWWPGRRVRLLPSEKRGKQKNKNSDQ
jgi:putative drug exporter of the RND superfamily